MVPRDVPSRREFDGGSCRGMLTGKHGRKRFMPTIDVQVHAYERNHPGRPWVGQLHGPQSANGEEMTAAMAAVGVDGAILVSSFNLYRYDPGYALQVYAKYPERFRVVTPVDPTNPAIDDVVMDWAKTKG